MASPDADRWAADSCLPWRQLSFTSGRNFRARALRRSWEFSERRSEEGPRIRHRQTCCSVELVDKITSQVGDLFGIEVDADGERCPAVLTVHVSVRGVNLVEPARQSSEDAVAGASACSRCARRSQIRLRPQLLQLRIRVRSTRRRASSSFSRVVVWNSSTVCFAARWCFTVGGRPPVSQPVG